MIPKFFDLVVWGHEHESFPNIRTCAETGVSFVQPGSTVATSLIEAEAQPKNVFMLRIVNERFSVKAIQLTQVRPMICK